jgi:hypothetical protein
MIGVEPVQKGEQVGCLVTASSLEPSLHGDAIELGQAGFDDAAQSLDARIRLAPGVRAPRWP